MADIESSQRDAVPEPIHDYEEEVELIDVLRVLWDRKWLIVGGTVACGLLGLAGSQLMVPMYEATVTMMISQPKLQADQETALPTSVPNLGTLIQNRTLAARLLEELGVNDRLSAADFVNDRLRVEQIRDTSMLSVHVQLERPDLAAEAANRLAELAIELNRGLNQQETLETRDFIKDQLDEATTRREALSDQLIRFRTEASLETLRVEIQTLTSRLGWLEADQFGYERNLRWQQQDQAGERLAEAGDGLLEFQRTVELPRARKELQIKLLDRERLEQQRTDLSVEIEGLQARLAEASTQIETNERFLEVPSSIQMDAPLTVSGRDSARQGAPPPASLRPDLMSPLLNPTYQILEQHVVTARTTLSGLRRQLEEVETKLETNSEELEALQSDVADKESRLEELERGFELARAEYMRLTETSRDGYEARLSVARTAEEETRQRLAELQAELYGREVRLGGLELEHRLTESIYGELVSEYEQARLRVAGRSAQLQVVDPAVPPRDPVSPRVPLNTLLALIAGGMLFTMLAFLIEYVQAAEARD